MKAKKTSQLFSLTCHALDDLRKLIFTLGRFTSASVQNGLKCTETQTSFGNVGGQAARSVVVTHDGTHSLNCKSSVKFHILFPFAQWRILKLAYLVAEVNILERDVFTSGGYSRSSQSTIWWLNWQWNNWRMEKRRIVEHSYRIELLQKR